MNSALPYAGVIQFRFNGYYLRRKATPASFNDASDIYYRPDNVNNG
jgi:hypothetical protein